MTTPNLVEAKMGRDGELEFTPAFDSTEQILSSLWDIVRNIVREKTERIINLEWQVNELVKGLDEAREENKKLQADGYELRKVDENVDSIKININNTTDESFAIVDSHNTELVKLYPSRCIF